VDDGLMRSNLQRASRWACRLAPAAAAEAADFRSMGVG
jgi:hypothetical protein